MAGPSTAPPETKVDVPGLTELVDADVLAGRKLHKRPHPVRWLVGALIVAGLVWLVHSFAQGQIRWGDARGFVFNHDILTGLRRTIVITVLSSICGIALGTVFAVMRLSSNPVASSVAWLYVWIFRGTPELLQLLIWFNLALVFPVLSIPLVGSQRTIDVITPFMAALIGLSINAGAYIAENIRGAILAVESGQTEAATALGLSRRATLTKVVLPQAMPALIPSIGNQTIGLLKGSSLAATIAYTELLGQAQRIYFLNARVMELLFVVALWYLVATSVASVLQYYVERYYGRSERNQRTSAADRLISGAFSRLRGQTA